ncbi:hypothetical protein [Endozoicomonas sp. SCSIO W0465]|uniref:hypothetical protein n=1 Tax=Endozoicomonas sp. SCSIO W0465 TaxID=2918516 RepID=UPI0020764E93|nr:hypothetical protein [Endozoicomonas sp. SCSIO W0465]USE34240.1 hypothetical protein MJO57_19005 [Endozoicomonas sp. SCSIO W0465]
MGYELLHFYTTELYPGLFMAKAPEDNNQPDDNSGNVIDMFTRKPLDEVNLHQIIRIAPELDGMEMLYSNDANPGKLFSMKILCWALMKDGTVDALIPWLNKVVPARELNDPLNGHWEGYFDKIHDHAFFDVPEHKVAELENTANYYPPLESDEAVIIQEIPDTIGTHAILTDDQFKTIVLVHVTSWRLYNDGRVMAMVADDKKVENTPVLPGDECLFAAQDHKDFHYFFHYVIANKIKHGDPEALAAFTHLVEG